jgi:hypothetical protein
MNRLGLSLLLLWPGSAFAPRQAPPPAPSSNAASSRPHVRAFVGEVLAVEPKAFRFSARESLKDGSLKSTTFEVSRETKFRRASSAAGFADLHPNDHVIVKYVDDRATRRKRAVSVTIVPPATTGR